MGRGIMHPLFGGNPFALLAVDRQFPFEQSGLAFKMIARALARRTGEGCEVKRIRASMYP